MENDMIPHQATGRRTVHPICTLHAAILEVAFNFPDHKDSDKYSKLLPGNRLMLLDRFEVRHELSGYALYVLGVPYLVGLTVEKIMDLTLNGITI